MRVRIEVDLNIEDEEAAVALAREYMIAQVDHATMEGNTFQMSKATPAESIDALLTGARPLATLTTLAVLARGTSQTSAVTFANVAASIVDTSG